MLSFNRELFLGNKFSQQQLRKPARGARSDARRANPIGARAPRPQEFAQQEHIHGFYP